MIWTGLAPNTAAVGRGPKYVSKKGKTPMLTRELERLFFDLIDTGTLIGLYDRALMIVYWSLRDMRLKIKIIPKI